MAGRDGAQPVSKTGPTARSWVRLLGHPPLLPRETSRWQASEHEHSIFAAGCRSGSQAPDQVHTLRTRVQIALLQPVLFAFDAFSAANRPPLRRKTLCPGTA